MSYSGESEYSGDKYMRGIGVALMFMVNTLVWFIPLTVLGQIANLVAGGPALAMWAVTLPMLPIGVLAVVTALGSMELITKTNVVDHTTEPAPDALDELQEAYVAGEIDEQELDERAAEVWER